MALQPPMLNFVTPQPVKVDALASELGMGQRHVRSALRWLVDSGYLIEHGPRARSGINSVRCLRLAWAKERVIVVATGTGAFHP